MFQGDAAVTDLRLLFCLPRPSVLPLAERQLLDGLRGWGQATLDRTPPLAGIRTGTARTIVPAAAEAVLKLAAGLCCGWPEPLRLQRPGCCCPLSVDEWTIARMARAAAHGDLAGFDAVCADLLPIDMRLRLFDWSAAAMATLNRPRIAVR